VAGDTLSLNTTGVALNYNSAHVSTASSISASGTAGFAIGSSSANSAASDYSFTPPTIAPATTGVSISPATLTATLTNTNVTKIYDGTNNAPTGFTPAYSLSGLVSGDTSATLDNIGIAYNDKNVLSANRVTVSGLSINSITGGNNSVAGDYVLDTTSKIVTANITPKMLTASIVGTPTKTYDGNTNATLSANNYTIAGLVGSETFTIDQTTGLYNNKNVTLANMVTATFSGSNFTGGNEANANNYFLPSGASGAGSITPKQLSGTLADGHSTYGSSLSPGAMTFSNIVGSDVVAPAIVTVNTAGLTSSSGNLIAGTHLGIETVSGVLSGTDAANYSFSGAIANYTVDKMALTGAAIANISTTYGTPAQTGTVTFANTIAGDLVSSNAVIDKQLFSSSNNLKAGSYTQTAGAISGADASNYTFTGYTTPTASYEVSKLLLTGTLASGSSTYGSALNPGALNLTGVITGDTVNPASVAINTTGLLSTSGNLKAGSYTGIQSVGNTLNGGDAANYTFAGAIGDYTVSKAALTVTATGQNKTYDGNTTANPTLTITGGLVGSETLTLNATASFNSRNVDAANLITVNNITLADGANGGLGVNYSITAGQTVAASITKLTSVAWVGSSPGNWSVASNWAGGALPDRANVSNVTIPANTTVTYDTGVDPTTALNTINVGANGGLALAGSTLTINTSLTTPNYVQTGGTLGGTGTVTVSNSFTKSGGVLADTLGKLSINQSYGNLAFSNLQALTLGAVNALGGNIEIETTGGLTTTNDKIKSSTGSVRLVTHSPQVIGSGGVDAATGITLEALTPSADSTITVNGTIQTASGPIVIATYGNVAQNASISGGSVDIGSSTGNITVASGAVTSAPVISYKASAGMISSNPSNFSGSKPNLTAVSVQTTQSADPCVADPLAPGCPGAIQAAAVVQVTTTSQAVKDITIVQVTPVATTGLMPVAMQITQNVPPATAAASAPTSTPSSTTSSAPASTPSSTTSSAPASSSDASSTSTAAASTPASSATTTSSDSPPAQTVSTSSSSDSPPAQTTAESSSKPSDSGAKEQTSASSKNAAAKEKEPAAKEKEPAAKEKEPAAKENEPAKEKEAAPKDKETAEKDKKKEEKKEEKEKKKEEKEKDKKEKEKEKEKKEKEEKQKKEKEDKQKKEKEDKQKKEKEEKQKKEKEEKQKKEKEEKEKKEKEEKEKKEKEEKEKKEKEDKEKEQQSEDKKDAKPKKKYCN